MNWCLQAVVLEKTLESPLDSTELKLVNPKGYQPWVFIGKSDAEAEAPVLWPPDVKSWLTRKDFDAGKDWEQEEMGATEDKMGEWHHRLDGHELEPTPGDSEGQVCCSPWDLQRVRDELPTEQQRFNLKLILIDLQLKFLY